MNANDRAAQALLVLRADIDAGAPGDHRTAALGALLELWAASEPEDWLRVAVAELWRWRGDSAALRVLVDDCLRSVSLALVAEAAPRRTTILPPASGDEEREERAAARATLESIEVRGEDWGAVAACSTMPASAEWFEAERRLAMGGGLRL
jgi:hypothetical protein